MISLFGVRDAESGHGSITLAGWGARKNQSNIVRIKGLYRWP